MHIHSLTYHRLFQVLVSFPFYSLLSLYMSSHPPVTSYHIPLNNVALDLTATVRTMAAKNILTSDKPESYRTVLAETRAALEVGFKYINPSRNKPNKFIVDYAFSYKHIEHRYPTKNKTSHSSHTTVDSVYNGLRFRAASLSVQENNNTKWAQTNQLFVADSKAVNGERSHTMTAHKKYTIYHKHWLSWALGVTKFC